MALVEETASYLDGPGRQESKKLDRSAALAYATESMRLTTRLMQLASWLLLHRAVKEGEMSLAQANKEKTKVKLSLGDRADRDTMDLLPEPLRELIDRSLGLLDRVRRLDATMHSTLSDLPMSNAVERQIGLLKAASSARHGNARPTGKQKPPRERGFCSWPMWRGPLLPVRRTSSGSAKDVRHDPSDAAVRRSRPGATSYRCRDAACRPSCPRWCGW